jgi:hypothetical protein
MDYILSNNVSEKYHAVWIAPERTGSRTVAQILNYFGFRHNLGPIDLLGGIQNYSHHFSDPELFNDWLHICNARNPYARTYSVFKMIDKQKGESFKDFILQRKFNHPSYGMLTKPTFLKKPEYVLRLENLKEDFLKIPFVRNNLTETQLDYMCTHGKELTSWEIHYNDEMKEIVYEMTKHQFEAWGYEK